MSMHWTQIHLWQQEGWAEKHREVGTLSPSFPAQAMAFLASYHPLEQEWRPLLWPIPLSPSPDTLWRERGVKPLGRKGLLVWGNWPDPGRGQGFTVPPSFALSSPLFLFLLFSLSLSLFWTVFGFNIKKILASENELGNVSSLFWKKRDYVKLLLILLCWVDFWPWRVLIKELLNDRFLFFDAYRSIQIVCWLLVEVLSLVVFKQLIHLF